MSAGSVEASRAYSSKHTLRKPSSVFFIILTIPGIIRQARLLTPITRCIRPLPRSLSCEDTQHERPRVGGCAPPSCVRASCGTISCQFLFRCETSVTLRLAIQAGGVSCTTTRMYLSSGTMTSSCFFVRRRKSFSSSCGELSLAPRGP